MSEATVSPVTEELQRQYLQEALQVLDTRKFVRSAAWYMLVDTALENLPADLLYDNDFGLFTTRHSSKAVAVWLQPLVEEQVRVWLPVVVR